VGGVGGLILGSWPLLTFGAGLDTAGTGPVGVVGPSGVMTALELFWIVVVVVVWVVGLPLEL